MLLALRLRLLTGVLSVAALCSTLSAAPTALSRAELQQGFVNGRLLAKPKSATKDDQLSDQETRLGVKLHHQIKGQTSVRVLEFSPKSNVRQTAARLRASGLYEYVEPDFIRHPHAVPNDPRFGEQWSLSNAGQQGGTVSADIAAVPAWDKRHDASNVIVAIIDSGLRPTHEDLAANLWTNPNPTADGYLGAIHGINTLVTKGTAGDGDISDSEGHGTAVASVIGAVGNNGAGMSGVAWKVQLMPLKFNDATDVALSSNEVICINYAISHGAKIINFSYGSHGYSQAEYDAIKAARDAGVIFVTSAGNEGLPLEMAGVYPASYLLDNIVTVGNTDRTDTLASSSNFGNVVDLAAPGTDITVCTKDGNSSYDTVSGTSLSAPAVSGALALLTAQYSSDNYRQLINRMLNSVTRLTALGGHIGTAGRLNLNQALSSTNNRPFNDNFASAAPLSNYWAFARASSKGATSETHEPNHGAAGGASLWWVWVPQSSGTAYVDTAGSDFDTIAAVYTGTTLANLTQLASNDDAPGLKTSRLSFNAVEGTTYYIAVDGKNGATGEVALAVDVSLPNDNFANAYALNSDLTDAYATDTIRFSTKESNEPALTVGSETGTGRSVWYTWQAQNAGPVTATVFSESFESIVGVYSGNTLTNLTLLGSGIESAPFNANAGQTYYIKVDTIDSNVGAFFLNMVSSSDAIPLATDIYSSPAVDASGNVVVVDSASVIGYFTPGTGDGSWEAQLFDGSVSFNSPAFADDGTFYVTCSTGVYKVSPNQSIIWSKSYPGTSGSSASPGIGSDGTVYIHSDDGTLHAYTSAGVEKWAANVPGSSASSPVIAVDGTIYIGSDDHHLYAINAVDGMLAWKFDAGASIQASPAIDWSNSIDFGTLGSKFFSLRPDGTQRYVVSVNDEVHSSAAIDNQGNAFFGANDGSLYRADTSGGLSLLQTLDSSIYSSPTLLSDQTLVVGSSSGIFYKAGLSPGINTTWQTAGSIFSSPAFASSSTQSSIVFGSVDHKVYFLPTNALLGAGAWQTFRGDNARTGRAKSLSNGPIIHAVSASQAFAAGTNPVLSVAVEGAGPFSFSWSLNGTPLGATDGSLVLNNFTAGMAGTYTVTVTNNFGSATSSPIVITEQAPADHSAGPGRIINLSARAYTGDDAKRLIVGLIIGSGTGSKPILVRGVGPSLAPRGVTTFIDDPALNLYTGSTISSANDNWGTDSAVPTSSSVVGAVPLVTSRDAALVTNLTQGGYTAQIVGGSTSNGNGGVALAEFYDASPTITSDTPLLTNISARAYVGQGDQVLIIGFIIGGNSPVKVLIRGLGPELTHQSVPNVLADPTIRLVNQADGSTIVANDNWGDAANVTDIQAAISQVNAAPFDAGSKDSAILTTLNPGGYTVVISGVNSATGIGLAELFAVP